MLSEWNSQNPQMHVGTQRFTTSDEHLAFLARHGVRNMSVSDLTFDRDRGWDAEEIAQKREKCARYV